MVVTNGLLWLESTPGFCWQCSDRFKQTSSVNLHVALDEAEYDMIKNILSMKEAEGQGSFP